MPITTKKATLKKRPRPATPEEVWATLHEVSKGQKETDRQLNRLEKSQEETNLQIKEAGKHLKRLEKLFEDQWGKLMEALVKGDLIKLLNERKIEVQGIAREHSRVQNGKEFEFDIIAINGDTVVVVEVKTTLRLQDVENFIKKLKVFKNIFEEYKNKKIYGAVAYLKANAGADKNSERKGLFVIRATGSSASITNKKEFRAKEF